VIKSVTELWPPNFDDLVQDVWDHGNEEYDLAGGRGSCKSSTIAEMILLLMRRYSKVNAVLVRKVKNTVGGSVYTEILKAANRLGYSDIYKRKASTHEFTNKRTGQKILTLGLDDKEKSKGCTVEHGYIGIVWFEERTEYTPEEIQAVKQSLLRGSSGPFWCFTSFNPPLNKNNWCNDDLLVDKPGRLVHRSNYLTVPREWLGEYFIHQAEWIKKTTPLLYRNEYLGESVGTGLQIFDNVAERAITDDEIRNFNNRFHGLDWGYWPHPWAYVACAYDDQRQDLYIYDEMKLYRKGNEQSSRLLLEHICKDKRWQWYGMSKPRIPAEAHIMLSADAAEPKSVGDYTAYGWHIRAPKKDRGYAFKWLQTRAHIYIDRKRCPLAWLEFARYEHEVDRQGRIVDDYPDAPADGDDIIAATRYATEPVYRIRGC
jgi:PBSX family phage terminase large subunit